MFEQTIPEQAMHGVAIVLLDELETLAVSRHQLSLDANPIDVHRATDAVLAGMDRLTREHRNVLLIGTTNFPKALDSAVISRADHIEEIGLPPDAARREIILDTLGAVGGVWKAVKRLEHDVARLSKAANGLDGRRIRKGIFVAMASDIETAKDPGKLTTAQIEAAFQQAAEDAGGVTAMRIRRDVSSIPASFGIGDMATDHRFGHRQRLERRAAAQCCRRRHGIDYHGRTSGQLRHHRWKASVPNCGSIAAMA